MACFELKNPYNQTHLQSTPCNGALSAWSRLILYCAVTQVRLQLETPGDDRKCGTSLQH